MAVGGESQVFNLCRVFNYPVFLGNSLLYSSFKPSVLPLLNMSLCLNETPLFFRCPTVYNLHPRCGSKHNEPIPRLLVKSRFLYTHHYAGTLLTPLLFLIPCHVNKFLSGFSAKKVTNINKQWCGHQMSVSLP